MREYRSGCECVCERRSQYPAKRRGSLETTLSGGRSKGGAGGTLETPPKCSRPRVETGSAAGSRSSGTWRRAA